MAARGCPRDSIRLDGEAQGLLWMRVQRYARSDSKSHTPFTTELETTRAPARDERSETPEAIRELHLQSSDRFVPANGAIHPHPCAGINRHTVGNERVLQERSSEPPDLESCGGGREAVVEA